MVLPIREGDIPGIQLRVRRPLRIDRDQAWRWLTEPGRVERWLADRAEIEPGEHGRLVLERASARTGERVIEIGRTERWNAGRSWALSFRRDDPRWEAPTRLELSVLDAGDGPLIDVFHAGFHRLAMSACLTIWEEYRRHWRQALERLDQVSAGAPGVNR